MRTQSGDIEVGWGEESVDRSSANRSGKSREEEVHASTASLSLSSCARVTFRIALGGISEMLVSCLVIMFMHATGKSKCIKGE